MAAQIGTEEADTQFTDVTENDWYYSYEITDSGEKLHYSPYTGGVETGVRYTDNGSWDIYLTVLPMFSLSKPELYSDILRSVLNDYKEG